MTPNAFKPIRLILSLCVFALSFGLPGHAQIAASPVISGPPDVLVIVSQQPGGADAVDITYAHQVPHAQAVQDSQALIKAGGWPVSASTVTDAAGPLQNRPKLMTGVIFQAIGVIPKGTNTLPIGTFVQALHTYKRFNVVFFITPPFQLQGARSYADSSIRMTLDQHGTSYVYQIEIMNPNSGSLPSLGTVQAAATHRSPWLLLVGILGLAALAGLVVYLLTARLTPKDNPNDESERKADSRIEVGTKS
jgi:hypothetical protein